MGITWTPDPERPPAPVASDAELRPPAGGCGDLGCGCGCLVFVVLPGIVGALANVFDARCAPLAALAASGLWLWGCSELAIGIWQDFDARTFWLGAGRRLLGRRILWTEDGALCDGFRWRGERVVLTRVPFERLVDVHASMGQASGRLQKDADDWTLWVSWTDEDDAQRLLDVRYCGRKAQAQEAAGELLELLRAGGLHLLPGEYRPAYWEREADEAEE